MQLGRRQRLRKQVALSELAPHLDQLLELSGILDALCHGAQVQDAGQIDHRGGQCPGFAGLADLVDERLVDLEDIDREGGERS